jgi:hypothetical protein
MKPVRELVMMQVQRKAKSVSTLEAQEEMYKKRLEEREWRQGLTIEEMLDRVNDPSRFARSRRSKP